MTLLLLSKKIIQISQKCFCRKYKNFLHVSLILKGKKAAPVDYECIGRNILHFTSNGLDLQGFQVKK